MVDDIARFFLNFSHDTIIVPLLVLGYIWIDQKFFLNAIYLILVSILLNFALKISFQVPLASHLGKEGFAFPSGHMQTSFVFYCWLMTKFRKPLYRSLIILLLIGIGWALVQCGYHNYIDVFGGVFFGGLAILGYMFLVRFDRVTFHLLMVALSTALLVYIAVFHFVTEAKLIAYCTLLGLIFSEKIFKSKEINLTFRCKMFSTVFCLITLFVLKIVFDFFLSNSYLIALQSILVGICLPFSLYVGKNLGKIFHKNPI